MSTTQAEPRIYVACLASYNAGRLFGRWIDCEGKDADELRVEIDDMLAESPEPNVMRRKCPESGHYQTDARPHRENEPDCSSCGATLPDEFKPSAEEWAIHDHEGFGGFIKSEWPDLDELAAMAEGLAGDYRTGFLWPVEDQGQKPSEALDNADEVIVWHWPASNFSFPSRDNMLAEYAQEFTEETGDPDARKAMGDLWNYIDWQSMGHDWDAGGDIDLCAIDGEDVIICNPREF